MPMFFTDHVDWWLHRVGTVIVRVALQSHTVRTRWRRSVTLAIIHGWT